VAHFSAESVAHFTGIRNHAIHGNCDPEAEQIESVYFEGKRPLFKEPGDNIGKFLEALERQYEPESVVKDYEDTHAFLADIATHLEPSFAPGFRTIIQDRYPGYDVERKKVGCVLPEHVIVGSAPGLRYDDELSVEWG
jgi:hypothetical protein